MLISSVFFKLKARNALKGNWQTALLVTFFSGIFMTVASLFSALYLPQADAYLAYSDVLGLLEAYNAVPQSTYVAYFVILIVGLLVSPVLMLGACNYFISRIKGEELGLRGMFSRVKYAPRATWLYLRMSIQIALWSMLFIIPGIIAVIRYSLAPYYMAENPDITVAEAIRKSKERMKNLKLTYAMLMISFIGLQLISMLLQSILISVAGVVVALVATQFMSLFISTYAAASIAAFYYIVTNEGDMKIFEEQLLKQIEEEQDNELN